MQRIYLDHAATTPILPEVMEIMLHTSKTIYGNPSSIHREGVIAKNLLEESRKKLATFLNASASQIYFTSCATESNNLFLQSEICSDKYSCIITTQIEHPSVLNVIRNYTNKQKIKLIYLDIDCHGRINLSELKNILSQNKNTLVSLMHINNEIGTIHPISEIATLCKEFNATFHSDTVQSLGLTEINVGQLGLDCIVGSAHKFNGPKGVGFTYLKNPSNVQPMLFGGSQERNIRAGTENLMGIVGMVKALEMAISQRQERLDKIQFLKKHLILGLRAIKYPMEVNSPEIDCSPKITNIYFHESKKTDWLQMNLDIEGIAISGGSACSSGTEKISHVSEVLRKGSKGRSIRFSLSHLNTLEEIELTINILEKLLNE